MIARALVTMFALAAITLIAIAIFFTDMRCRTGERGIYLGGVILVAGCPHRASP